MNTSPPQFVMFAFDGSKSVAFWETSRAFARNTGIRFTYFISGVYFLTDKDRKDYDAPGHGRGKSDIGFGGTRDDVVKRLAQVRLALDGGLEIASHANGHFNGSLWTHSQWRSEFAQFQSILSQAWTRYDPGHEPKNWKSYFAKEVDGFRAPSLAVSHPLWQVLNEAAYSYDTSLTNKMGYWPQQRDGIWNFPLVGLAILGQDNKPTGKNTLSMDYNFYVAQSSAKEGQPSEFKRYEDEMYNTYMAYFNNNYFGKGNRAPIHIGHHFSLWNGGAYWKALQRVARTVSNKKLYPDVVCGTYKELVQFLNEKADWIDAYQNGNFKKRKVPEGLEFMNEISDEEFKALVIQSNAPPRAHE